MNTQSIDKKIKCEKCGETLTPSKVKWLELSQTDGKYYTAIPAGHISQGSFPFGSACAKSQLTPVSIDKEVLDSGNWFENEWRKLERKGYNPASMEELYKALETARQYIVKYGKPPLQDIEAHESLQIILTALNNAKI